jgi:hypothetical protein
VWWPALDAARGLAQAVLAACWAVDGPGSVTPVTAPRAAAITVELDALARAATSGTESVPAGGDGFLARDLDAVRRALPRVPVTGRR